VIARPITMLALALSAILGAATASRAVDKAAPAVMAQLPPGAHDFDFERGEWLVHHRTKKPGQAAWTEFDGTCRDRLLVDGSANVEEHTFHRASGVAYGIALRTYDPKSRLWAIWWVDGRDPHGALDPPVRGRFESGVGTFYVDSMVNGKATRTRFIWSHITATSARWEQADSSDGGKLWDTNWVMEFRRTSGGKEE
jgi:hypothetical protein